MVQITFLSSNDGSHQGRHDVVLFRGSQGQGTLTAVVANEKAGMNTCPNSMRV